MAFFSFFFVRPPTSSCMYHFLVDFTRFTVNPAVTGSSPCFSQKRFQAFAEADETEGSPLPIFFGTVRLFFHFFAFKGTHLQVFLIFCSKLKCQKAQRVYLFKYFGTMRLSKILIFRFFLENFRNPFYSFKNLALFEPKI